MSSNMLTLDRLRPMRSETGRPSRAEAEAAFRTIIRWEGDDPHRDGLIETPSRALARSRIFSRDTRKTPTSFYKKPSRKSRATTKW